MRPDVREQGSKPPFSRLESVMATLAELIEAKRSALTDLKKNYDSNLARQRGILNTAKDEARDKLTALEAEEIATLRAEATATNSRIDAAERAIGELESASADQERIEEGEKEQRETTAAADTQTRGYENQHRVTSEKRTYNENDDRKGVQFIRDVTAALLNRSDFEASDRLQRHMREEQVERGAETLKQQQRAAGTTAFAGLVVPQYLTDQYAPAAKALRPFADVCNHHDLPESGMTVNISRITTPTSVALQASQNAAVSETNIDDTLLTLNVLTAAGQQTLSRQAIERGTGVEEVTIEDLMTSWATSIDSTLITQATTGLAAASTSVAYTDASPTAAELYPKILAASAASEAGLLAVAAPDVAVMHSRRWYWMQSQLTSTWPLFQQSHAVPQTAGNVDTNSKYGSGFRGVLPSGLNVIVDNNVGTTLGAGTEDEIYVLPSREAHLWEDPDAPMFIRAEQPAVASLGVLLVLYSYFAYTFGRYPDGFQKIAGTGLIAPTFA
jgi:hypothetical protein